AEKQDPKVKPARKKCVHHCARNIAHRLHRSQYADELIVHSKVILLIKIQRRLKARCEIKESRKDQRPPKRLRMQHRDDLRPSVVKRVEINSRLRLLPQQKVSDNKNHEYKPR